MSAPEGSAQTLTHDVLSQSGACKGVYMGHAYSVPTIEQMFTMNNTYGATFKAVSIGKTSLTSNTLTYGIAYTSKHPKEAAEVLNLIWTDEYVMSTLIYGLEGVSWEWNADKSSIQYPEGLGDRIPFRTPVCSPVVRSATSSCCMEWTAIPPMKTKST